MPSLGRVEDHVAAVERALIAEFRALLKEYKPSQRRDRTGMWTDGGGGGNPKGEGRDSGRPPPEFGGGPTKGGPRGGPKDGRPTPQPQGGPDRGGERETKAPLGAQVVQDMRAQMRERFTHDEIQAVVDRMRNYYRATGKLRFPKKVAAEVSPETLAALTAEFEQRQERRQEENAPPKQKKPTGVVKPFVVDKASGNPEALIEWFNAGADGQIAWGSHGDFDSCVAIASEHMSEEQAQGFCQNRHQDATGEAAGRGAHKAVEWHYAVTKAEGEKRFTLGPFYIPNRLDAHGEWTTPEDLQQGIWDYVRKGYRDIHLQHTDRKAGEWVEIVSWPYATTAELTVPGDVNKAVIRKEEFPEGTAYMGVVWEPWAWEEIHKGNLRGLSMGGFASRVEVEFTPKLAKAADPFEELFGDLAQAAPDEEMESVAPAETTEPPIEDEAEPLDGEEQPIDDEEARRDAAARASEAEAWSKVLAAWTRYQEFRGISVGKASEHPFLELLDRRSKDFLVSEAVRWLQTGPTPGRMLEVAELVEEDLTDAQLRALLALEGDEAYDLLILGACEVFGDATVEQAIEEGPEQDEPEEFEELGEDEETEDAAPEVAPEDEAAVEEEPEAPTEDVAAEDVPPEDEEEGKKKPPFVKYSPDQPRDEDGRWVATGVGAGIATTATVGAGETAPTSERPEVTDRFYVEPTSGTWATSETGSAQARVNITEDIVGAGFNPESSTSFVNDMGHRITLQDLGHDKGFIVNQYDTDGRLTSSERLHSDAEYGSSKVSLRLFVDTSMRSEGIFSKMAKRIAALLKHGDHDQSTHGNWATGTSAEVSGAGAAPGQPFPTEGLDPDAAKATVDKYAESIGGTELLDRVNHLREVYASEGAKQTDKLFESGIDGLPIGEWSAERTAAQLELVNEVYEAASDIPNDHMAVLIGGIAGAGKGFAQETLDLGYETSDYMVVNPDDFKALLAAEGMDPAVNALTDGEKAFFLHEESSRMAGMLYEKALADGKNVVYDWTMSSASSVEKKLQPLLDNGYTVRMAFVDTPPDMALAQAMERYYMDGEFSGRVSAFDHSATTPDSPPNLDAFKETRDAANGGWVEVGRDRETGAMVIRDSSGG